MIAKSTKILEIMRTAEWVAPTDVLIHLTGEPGSGKQSFALQLHKLSSRNGQAMFDIDCHCLSQEELCEQLFGHSLSDLPNTKASSSSLLAQARGSTLHIKGVNHFSQALQSKLLHYIESSELIQSEHSDPKRSTVRLIISSEENLSEATKSGQFRNDLYYRLNTIALHVPALRSRTEDIVPLINDFFQQLVKKHRLPAPSFSRLALKKITKYTWPGNIDELSSFCESMFFSNHSQQIDIAQLPTHIRDIETHSVSAFILPEKGIKLDCVESDFIIQALNISCGNKSKAARLLGLSRDTLLYRIKKHDISI